MTPQTFRNRLEAGERLASELKAYKADPCVVLGIPRGGVIVGFAIAQKLGAPLGLVFLRKLPVPWSPEAGFGAITSDGTLVLNPSMVSLLRLSQASIDQIAAEVLQEVKRREQLYGAAVQQPELTDRVVILVDDGLATGYTMLAAIKAARKQNPRKVVVAAPVSPLDSYNLVKAEADNLVCLIVVDTESFAVASFYQDFPELSDSEILEYLRKAEKQKAEGTN